MTWYVGSRLRIAVRKAMKCPCKAYKKWKRARTRAEIEGIVGRVPNWHPDRVPVSHETQHLDRHGNKIVVWVGIWDGDEFTADYMFDDGGLAMNDLFSRFPNADKCAERERLVQLADAPFNGTKLHPIPQVRGSKGEPGWAICKRVCITTECADIAVLQREKAIECVAQAYLAVDRMNPEEAKQDG